MMTSMLDCETVMRRLWDYLDGELTVERMREIELHLAHCERCRPHAEFRRAFRGAVAGAGSASDDTDALSRRVRAALQAAAGGG
ncbi:MAG: zf-HC2 domain-containing protein [Gemmatimonadaceae bacterium]|nr:zf-HC2 domain-containing protein [Gemmatimonadaceae bacterium]